MVEIGPAHVRDQRPATIADGREQAHADVVYRLLHRAGHEEEAAARHQGLKYHEAQHCRQQPAERYAANPGQLNAALGRTMIGADQFQQRDHRQQGAAFQNAADQDQQQDDGRLSAISPEGKAREIADLTELAHLWSSQSARTSSTVSSSRLRACGTCSVATWTQRARAAQPCM